MAKVVVEIFNEHGLRHDYRILEGNTIRIGRGYDNDLILFDPYVAGTHAILHLENNALRLEDLNSMNGLRLEADAAPVKEVVLESGGFVFIGKTKLRFSLPYQTVAQEKSLGSFETLSEVNDPLKVWLAVVTVALVYVGLAYLKIFEPVSLSKIISIFVWIIILFVFWAGVWAMVGRMIKHRSQFLAQLFYTAVFSLAAAILSPVGDYWGFALSSVFLNKLIDTLIWGALFSGLLTVHLNLATHIPRLKRIGASICVSAFLILLAILFEGIAKEETPLKPDFYSVLKPPYIKTLPAKSVDGFVQRSQTIFDEKFF